MHRGGVRATVEVDRAVKLAKENGWLELNGLHRMRLTEAGRSQLGGVD